MTNPYPPFTKGGREGSSAIFNIMPHARRAPLPTLPALPAGRRAAGGRQAGGRQARTMKIIICRESNVFRYLLALTLTLTLYFQINQGGGH